MATGLRDRYRVERTIGAGGMGSVVLAEDCVLGRPVALKRLHPSSPQQGAARFRREARLGAALSHPNLVAIYDIFQDGEDLLLVMEYVHGETLRQALRGGPLPAPHALRVLDAVAAGLDYAHSHGVVHRDVKPSNILLGQDGVVKLADLGVAASVDRTRITTSGALLGTVPYMAPEQLAGQTAAAQADVYGLAAVAFEALSGVRARPEDNPLALAHALAHGTAPDLRERWPEAPAAAIDVLRRGMDHDPQRRPTSAGELVGRLREGLAPAATVAANGRPGAPPAANIRRGAPVAADAGMRARPAAGSRAPAQPPRDARPGARRERGPRRSLLALGALLAASLVVGLAIALAGSGSSHPSARRTRASSAASVSAHSRSAARTAGSAATATPAAASGPVGVATGAPAASTPAAPAPAAAGPTAAVESFYELAAAHRYAQAWQLADPAFRSQLGGFSSFSAQQSHVSSIRFDQAAAQSQTPTAATVAVRTTPVVNGGTQHCSGTVSLQRPAATAAWLLHQISINC